MDSTYLKRHYSLLTDEELRQIRSDDLVDEARPILYAELSSRGLGSESTSTTKAPTAVFDPEKVPKAAPPWSRKLVLYAQWSPLLLLPALGVRGVLWIALISFVSRFAALKYAAHIRSTRPSHAGAVRTFVICHLIVALAFVFVLKVVWAAMMK